MTTKGTPRPPKSKGNSDELAALKERLDQQAQQLADQRQQIIDLQGQLAAASKPLDEAEIEALEEADDLDPVELYDKYGRARYLLHRALETIEMYREKTREQASPNKCKLYPVAGKQHRRARAFTMYGIAAQYGLIPVIDLYTENPAQLAHNVDNFESVLGIIELMYEAAHIMDMPPLPDDSSIQVEGEL